jgi:hypothetical protein
LQRRCLKFSGRPLCRADRTLKVTSQQIRGSQRHFLAELLKQSRNLLITPQKSWNLLITHSILDAIRMLIIRSYYSITNALFSVSDVCENFTCTPLFINCQCVYCVSVEPNVTVVDIRLVYPSVRYNRHMRTRRAGAVEIKI